MKRLYLHFVKEELRSEGGWIWEFQGNGFLQAKFIILLP